MFLGVKFWASNNDFDGNVAYVFESGEQHQSEAKAFMDKVFKHPQMRRDFKYSSHKFENKADSANYSALIFWRGTGLLITKEFGEGK
jgi:hypothetical protein